MKIKNKNSQETITSWDELISGAPAEIKEIIEKCKNTPQSPKWHPEGSCYIHTRIVFDRAKKSGDINLIISALFHDLGKPATLALNKKNEYSNHGHDRVSARLVEKYKDWVNSTGAYWFAVYNIVNEHMRIKYIKDMRQAKQQILKDNPFYNDIVKFTAYDDMSNLTGSEMTRYS